MWRVKSITKTVAGFQLVHLDGERGRIELRLSTKGRLIMVWLNGRTLMDRSQRKQGGERIRMASKPSRQCRDTACSIVAARALGMTMEQLPSYEIEL